ncbi:MAG: serine hydrolase [Planctomycetes bacterium]|nr:serine hydrolase [Planctomycetota bacterium]
MRRILLLLLAGCNPPSPMESLGALGRNLHAALGETGGGVFYRDLQDGETIEIRGEDALPAGDAIAIPVLVAVVRDSAEGRYRLDDERTVDAVPGAEPGPEVAALLGKKASIRRMIDLMIAGDPVARGNLVHQAGGPEGVARRMRSAGMERSEAGGAGVPREYGRLLDSLGRGEIVSPAASAEMLSWLSRSPSPRAGVAAAAGRSFVFVVLAADPAAVLRVLREHVSSKR